jgi:hypothetical protein
VLLAGHGDELAKRWHEGIERGVRLFPRHLFIHIWIVSRQIMYWTYQCRLA